MHITFIQTGGTIDKDYPKTQKGDAFEITEPAVGRILEKLNPHFEYEIIPLLQKDSLEITAEDRELILQTCLAQNSQKIIITHGTDTLIQTAQKLSSIQDKAIVLVGAMRPERFSNSDAPVNIGLAIGAVNVLQKGVYIAMHGRVYPWYEVARDQNTGQFVSS